MTKATNFQSYGASPDQTEDQEAKPVLFVVCVAIMNEQNQILMAQRPKGKMMAGFWEFPGGKVEIGETPEHALIREIEEELSITLNKESLEPLTFISYGYEDFHVLLPLYICRNWEGDVQMMEHQDMKWLSVDEIADQKMLEGNFSFIPHLKRYLEALD